KLLATASGDGTILLWQLDCLPGLKLGPGPLDQKQLAALWDDLGSKDAAVAYRAIVRLCQDAETSSPALVAQLRSLWKHDAKQVQQLMCNLESEKFVVRAKARAQLEDLQDAVAPALQKALQGNSSVESARRLELLLTKLNGPTPTSRQLHVLRAME